MNINALMMDATDNVVTCMTEIPAGETVCYRKGEEYCTVVAREAIPYCHKIAVAPIQKGGQVIKYGESLGEVSCDIEEFNCFARQKGTQWVNSLKTKCPNLEK